jgi:hypothetical protein
MEQEKQIQEYLGRPCRYANIDGVTEMTAGLTWFGFAMVAWIPSFVPKGLVWPIVVSWFLLFVWFALLQFGSKALKRHVTYPRTGFVSYPAAQSRRIRTVAFFAGMAVSATLGFLAVRRPFEALQPALLIAAGMTLSYGILARPMRPWKWAILALMAAGGAGLVFLRAGFRMQAVLELVFYGAMFLAAGLISLTDYLRHSQPAEQVTE